MHNVNTDALNQTIAKALQDPYRDLFAPGLLSDPRPPVHACWRCLTGSFAAMAAAMAG